MQMKVRSTQSKQRQQQPLPASEVSALSILGNSMSTRIDSVSI